MFSPFLKLSINQIVKTYKEVVKINGNIYRYLKYKKEGKFSKNNKSSKPKRLPITDSSFEENIKTLKSINFQEKDLIDFEDEKDLIDFGNEEAKDLIDLNTIIPPKNQQRKNFLWMKNYFPKVKNIKFLKIKI